MDEYNLGGKKLFKTTYGWDAEGNRLSEMQYNHGQSGTSGNNGNENNGSSGNNNGTGNNAVISGALFHAANVLDSLLEGGNSGTTSSQDTQNTPDTQSVRTTPEAPAVEIPSVDTERLSTENSIVNSMTLPDPAADTAAGVVLNNQAEAAEELNAQLRNTAAEAPKPETPETEADKPEAKTPDTELSEGNKPETGKDDASVEGNGDGNGQVPPGQTEDEDGNIVNPGGHMPPGLNRGEKGEKPDNPNKPEKPDNPGSEDNTDKQANKANKGTHKYTYDELNRMITSNIAGTTTTYTYDTLGNLVLEKSKNHVVDYQYNELNQLVEKKDGNESYTYTYDKRGNRTAEIGKKASRSYVYDETNRMVEGTNWKGDKSAYIYNGLGLRINNTHTTHAGKVYARDYVIDYTSFENDDLMVFAEGNGQLEYEQKHVYAGSERIEQFTDKGNWERTLYVHEDVMGNTRYYTKANGQSFAELTYDAWGMPESPNKLLNNDHGNYVFATFTGHIYDTTLDIYFAEARFYDANNRTWLAMDPVKDGQNWYQYCYSNPTTYWDPLGLWGTSTGSKQAQLSGSGVTDALGKIVSYAWNEYKNLNIAYHLGFVEGLLSFYSGNFQFYDGPLNQYTVFNNIGRVYGAGTGMGLFIVTAYYGAELLIELGGSLYSSFSKGMMGFEGVEIAGYGVAYFINEKALATGVAVLGSWGIVIANGIKQSISNMESQNGLDFGSKSDGSSEKVTTNQGNEIDITPNSNHSTTNRNPGYRGEPNSSIDILDKDGNISTRRWFDENGNAIRDVDMTNHGNPAQHPEWPHEHFWQYGPDGKPIGR